MVEQLEGIEIEQLIQLNYEVDPETLTIDDLPKCIRFFAQMAESYRKRVVEAEMVMIRRMKDNGLMDYSPPGAPFEVKLQPTGKYARDQWTPLKEIFTEAQMAKTFLPETTKTTVTSARWHVGRGKTEARKMLEAGLPMAQDIVDASYLPGDPELVIFWKEKEADDDA